jgi:hypothetical protein
MLERRSAGGEFMRRQLADEDHPGGFEPRRGLGVGRHDIVEQQPRVGGRAQPGRVVDVLQPIGNAVQRPARRRRPAISFSTRCGKACSYPFEDPRRSVSLGADLSAQSLTGESPESIFRVRK